jgi:CRP/FNR family transcriptional regulator
MIDEITDEGRRALLERSLSRDYVTGQTLWSAGDEPIGLFIVLQGKVRIIRAKDGRQTVIHSGESGATLGEIPFFTGSPYPATAIAAEPTRCLIINYQALEHALKVDPGVAFYLLRRLSLRIESLVERVSQMSAQSVQARLAAHILMRAERAGGGQDGRALSLGMTQSELAEELGTVREVVVRALRGLRDLGAIAPAGSGKYRVTDPAALKLAAKVGQ